MIKRLSFLIPLILFSACSLDPHQKQEMPVSIPDQWSVKSAPGPCRLSGQWWKDFNDEKLNQFICEAFANNPGLKEAESRVRQALALSGIAGAELKPFVSAELGASRFRQFMDGPRKHTRKFSSHNASLSLTWEADLWGRVRAAEAAALFDLYAQEAVHNGAFLSLAAQITKTYFTVLEAKQQVRIAQKDLNDATDLGQRIQERCKRGLLQVLDLKLSETEVDRSKAVLDAREQTLDTLYRSLETLLGRYPDASISQELNGALPALPPPAPPGAPAEILSRRPDLAAAENRIRANEARKQSAKRDLYPRIALTASTGLVSDRLRDIAQGDFGVWSLAGNLTAPLFEGNRLRATVNLRQAEEETARAAFVQTALNAFREVEVALSSEQKLKDRLLHLQGYVSDAEKAFEISQQRFLKGLLDLLNVLETRRRLYASRSACLNAALKSLSNRVDLYVALGGGFDYQLN